MGNINKVFWLINIAVLLFGLYSCTNIQTINKDKENNKVENPADSSGLTFKNKESVFFLLPSPGELLERFYSSEIQYNPGLLNSANNKDKYIGSKAQSLNLGVYITDMAYTALFEKPAETARYLETIQSLSNETGISSTIFESLLVRSKANAGKMDSLITISNEAFSNMIEFLEAGGKENTIALISTGAYIETLFIALQSVNKFSEGDKILDFIVELKYPVDNLLEKAKSITTSENDSTLFNYCNQISIIFNELETKSSKTMISQIQTGKISVSGGDKLRISEREFNKLKFTIKEIRKSMIGY